VFGERVTTARAARAKSLRIEDAHACRLAREAAGLTQLELARELGTQQQVVSAWEDGSKPHSPSTDKLRRAPAAYRRRHLIELASVDGEFVHPAPADMFGEDDMRRAVTLAARLAGAQRSAMAMAQAAGNPVQLEWTIRDGELALASLAECIESARRRLRARRTR
jgi:transcriptional regulator with XRE-family HTH domain